ncbi:hypothetical protein HMPREF0973_03088, partial [Prevotella veroralis F0319]
KQITTAFLLFHFALSLLLLPQRYIFSSKSQPYSPNKSTGAVVVATTKVHIFKQITTISYDKGFVDELLLLPQRYIFSSKSQLKVKPIIIILCCCCYHKGTYFQANHNLILPRQIQMLVVVATTKVHIFKQITT